MFWKYLLPLIALGGIAIAVVEVSRSEPAALRPTPPAALPTPPFPHFVAGTGLVEAATGNISVGSLVPGIVTRVDVRAGDQVKAGDPLFELDGRVARAACATRQAEVQVARGVLANARYDLQVAGKLVAAGGNTANDLEEKRFAAETAAAQLALAEANLQAAQLAVELLTVRAPVTGEVLQLNLRVGEFAPDVSMPAGPPQLLIGGGESLHVRVSVDETDAWRVQAGAAAIAFPRGNPRIEVPLKFVRFEPYVIPKTSLTGLSTERVDTRVLQVIYSFKRGARPIYAGQQLDVFIATP